MKAEAKNSNPRVGYPGKAPAHRRLTVLVFAFFLCVFAFKYHYEFLQTRRAMPLAGGPFSHFLIDVRFANVPADTAAKVHVGDQMRLRGWTVAVVVEKLSEEALGSRAREIRLRLRSPNWLRWYLDTSSGTEVVFKTERYALRGRIEQVGS
ncbi:MAG: hypothetical protein DRH70_03135 [Candidatus Coatesbacteria bacterium]|nr:MAG: hypothetical protein DRH70_03135 [Candidatus Coatesbacteria bacterium]